MHLRTSLKLLWILVLLFLKWEFRLNYLSPNWPAVLWWCLFHYHSFLFIFFHWSITLYNAAPAKSLQSCPTLCDPIDGSPSVSPIPGILQARTLEWVVISFSNAWKWKVKVKSHSRVRLFVTPWTVAYQAPPSMGFSRQEYWSGVPLPSPTWYTQFSSVQSLSHVRLFATPCIAARQASLSVTNSRSLLKHMPIELVMPSNHLILCCPLLLLPTIPPSIRNKSIQIFSAQFEEFLNMQGSFRWKNRFLVPVGSLVSLLSPSIFFNTLFISATIA